MDGPVAVVDVLAVAERAAHVTVAVARTVDGEFAVLALRVEDRETGNACAHRGELLNERFCRIVRSAVLERIETVGPETFEAENGNALVRRVNRNDGLLAELAGVLVVMAVIAKRRSALIAAIGAERGRRKSE